MPRWLKCTKWRKLGEDTLFPLLFELRPGASRPGPFHLSVGRESADPDDPGFLSVWTVSAILAVRCAPQQPQRAGGRAGRLLFHRVRQSPHLARRGDALALSPRASSSTSSPSPPDSAPASGCSGGGASTSTIGVRLALPLTGHASYRRLARSWA